MVDDRPLPEPDSETLLGLLSGGRSIALYGLLFRRRQNPPTATEIGYFLQNVAGEDAEDVDRALAPLRAHFAVVATDDEPARYFLTGWLHIEQGAVFQPIDLRLRAEVLAPQCCAQCGDRPIPDGARLRPAQRIPMRWGGQATRENLEPLCEDCATGRQQYFQRWDHLADQIALAVNHADPRMRLGEFLRVMSPAWVRADLLEAVASAKEYQDDWNRRLRDLRFLGWDYEHQNRKTEGSRTWAYYRFVKAAPWPVNIHAAIKAEADRRRAARKDRTADALDP
ncbi:hypothetical protein [Nocardioides sp. YIM 152315]|uniref:hypothetical protein n=1 Tax=Nocardioides sp. YIM 152315 TaxID=3031760 RepID=UPI0023DA4439|nr:hypothetical protein [Nocardioides sp. YIM 152315]MDF1605905.1 hypothetical protein [Nocardioides sp. YIM 152315]